MSDGDDTTEKIGELILERYSKFGKRGKQQNNEWTHLAAFCVSFPSGKRKLLSLATGTKCLGASEVSKEGYTVNDSHAEVLARRALVRYFLIEAKKVLTTGAESELFVKDSSNRVRFQNGICLYFVITYSPCGDAAIFPKGDLNVVDSQEDASSSASLPKRQKLEDEEEKADIFRTGAKCTANGPQDPMLPGVHYHQLGAWRTKPGRGERTLSMSCSDKMAKWAVMGVQGALLMHILAEPVYIHTVVLAGGCPYSEEAFCRAIIDRNSGFRGRNGFQLHSPALVRLRDFPLDLGPTEDSNCRPSHLGAWWHDGMDKPEILVDGYKQGVTRNNRDRESSRSVLCRWALARDMAGLAPTIVKTYHEMKTSAKSYEKVWTRLKEFYGYWVSDERKMQNQMFPVQR